MKVVLDRVPLDLTKEKQTITVNKYHLIHTVVPALDVVSPGVRPYLTATPVDLILAQNKDSAEIEIEILCVNLTDSYEIEDPANMEYITTLILDEQLYSFGYIISDELREIYSESE